MVAITSKAVSMFGWTGWEKNLSGSILARKLDPPP